MVYNLVLLMIICLLIHLFITILFWFSYFCGGKKIMVLGFCVLLTSWSIFYLLYILGNFFDICYNLFCKYLAFQHSILFIGFFIFLFIILFKT